MFTMSTESAHDLPSWLRGIFLFGDPKDDDDEGKKDEEDEDSEDDDEDDEDEDDVDDDSQKGGGSDDKKKSKEDDNAELLKALRSERKERKKLARELKRTQREKSSKKDSEDEQALGEKLTASEARVAKFGPKFRTLALNAVIREEAKDLGFVDMDDVLTGIDREDIDVEQDDEDPSEVTIDRDSVKEALAELKEKKPHWLKSSKDEDEDEDEERPVKSGSKMSGKKKKGTKTDEQTLRTRYPSL